jgi:cytochrome c-type biogenesis protein CcmH
VLLGGVFSKIQHYGEAADAYRHALALAPGDSVLETALGEALVEAAGGRVTPEASSLFRQAGDQPLAHYYGALEKSQAADWPGAMREWQALLAHSTPDDPWFQPASKGIADARRVLGIDQDR